MSRVPQKSFQGGLFSVSGKSAAYLIFRLGHSVKIHSMARCRSFRSHAAVSALACHLCFTRVSCFVRSKRPSACRNDSFAVIAPLRLNMNLFLKCSPKRPDMRVRGILKSNKAWALRRLCFFSFVFSCRPLVQIISKAPSR